MGNQISQKARSVSSQRVIRILGYQLELEEGGGVQALIVIIIEGNCKISKVCASVNFNHPHISPNTFYRKVV